MTRACVAVLSACLALVPATAPAAAPFVPPRKDRHGDPLPERAVARAGSVRLRHGGMIRAARFSADGKTITSFGDDDVLRFWDAATGRQLAARSRQGFRGSGEADAVAFSADGKLLAIACDDGKDYSSDGVVVVCDAASGKDLLRLAMPQAETIHCVDFSRDGKLVAACDNSGNLRVWAVAGGTPVSRIEWGDGMVTALAFSPDGRTLAAMNGSDTLGLWDVISGKRLRLQKRTWNANVQLNEDFLARLTFSADGRTLLTANSDWGVRLWDARTGKLLKVVVEPARRSVTQMFSDVGFSRDGKSVFIHLNVVEQVDLETGKARPLFRTDTTAYSSLPWSTSRPTLVLSPDGRRLAAWGRTNTLRLWNLREDREVRPPGGHRGSLTAVALSPDGRTLATGGNDAQLGMWDARTGAIRRLERVGTWPKSLAFTPDGKTLAWVDGYQWEVYRRDAMTGRPLTDLDVATRGRGVSLAVAGGILAVGMDREIALYDLAAKRVVGRIPVQAEWVVCLAFTPDGRRLAVGTDTDNQLRLYESPGGSEVPGFMAGHGPTSRFALSPDARAVASGRRLWEAASGEVRRTFEGCNCACFSPDGRLLAVGGEDGAVRLCDPLSGAERLRLKGHFGGVTALAFSADGRTLASASEDTTALVWNVADVSPRRTTSMDLDEAWEALLSDAAQASRAAVALLASPEKSAAFLRDRVRLPAFDGVQLRRWVADLDSDDLDVREAATRELRLIGKPTEPFLKKALTDSPSAEVRRRAGRLLRDLARPVPSPLTLRNLRAIEVLEHAGARETLQRFARLPRDSREAREAKEALARLEWRTR